MKLFDANKKTFSINTNKHRCSMCVYTNFFYRTQKKVALLSTCLINFCFSDKLCNIQNRFMRTKKSIDMHASWLLLAFSVFLGVFFFCFDKPTLVTQYNVILFFNLNFSARTNAKFRQIFVFNEHCVSLKNTTAKTVDSTLQMKAMREAMLHFGLFF